MRSAHPQPRTRTPKSRGLKRRDKLRPLRDTRSVVVVVVACRACGEALSRVVEELAEMPAAERLDDGIGYAPTVPLGNLAIDPGPVGVRQDGRPTSTLGCVVINPEDALALVTHPDPRRNSGCCGHDGLDGPNQLCPNCHAEVATLRDDCWSLVEVRFEPSAVLLTPARPSSAPV